jgi:hypothetical protein
MEARGPVRVPPRLLILLTNPRSGSTWLLDALRSHPGIYLEQGAVVFEVLGLKGRRYPADLSVSGGERHKIEVRPGRWESIAALEVSISGALGSAGSKRESYAIEKIHPHFYGFNVDRFVRRLRELEKDVVVKMCYLVRDPRESVISFLEYKKRNPLWNRNRAVKSVPEHMQRIYESILRTALAWPGAVIEYGELKKSFRPTLGKVFEFLWPGEKADGKLIERIYELTAREIRLGSGTRFIARRESSDRDMIKEYNHFLRVHSAEISSCYRAYEAVLQLEQSSRGDRQ